MKFDLHELNRLSIESIQLEFMRIPSTETFVEIESDFNIGLLGCNVLSAIPYIPLHVDSIKFTGSYCYQVESFDSFESREVIPDQVTCFLGPALQQLVEALPKNIVHVIFSLHHQRVLTDNQLLINRICDGLANILYKLPNHVASLDFSEMRDFGYPDNLHLNQFYESLPSTVHSIKLHKIRWGLTVVNHAPILQLLTRNLKSLHIENWDFLASFSTRIPGAFFSHLNPNLESLVLHKNRIGTYNHEHYLIDLFSSLPTRLRHLSLNENHLFNIDPDNFNELMQLLPKSLRHLELANNFILTLPTIIFNRVMNALPKHIDTLTIFESDVSNATREQLIENFACIPAQVKTLRISGGQFLGLRIPQMMVLLHKLPTTVSCLDFSDNHLNRVKLEELICLFAFIPGHVQRLRVSNNHLSSLTVEHMDYIFQRLPYQVYELDFSNNGFDRLTISKLNSLMSVLPETVIDLGQDKIILGADGKFIPYFSRPNDFVYRPLGKVRHQAYLSNYFLCISQIMKKYQFDTHIMLNIISNLVEIDETKHGQIFQRLINKANSFITQKQPVEELEVITTSRNRFKYIVKDALDWSYCGLGNMQHVEYFKNLFLAIPPEVKRINLRHNGFVIHSANMKHFTRALAFLPPQIIFLDLSGNHFEIQSKEYLRYAFSQLPATVQYVYFGDARPVSLANHLSRLDTPAYFLKILSQDKPFMAKAKHLLDDYGQNGYWFLRLIFGYWNRKNLEEVNKCVFMLKHNFFNNTVDFFNYLENISILNESGALAKSMMAIFKENQRMLLSANNQSRNPSQ